MSNADPKNKESFVLVANCIASMLNRIIADYDEQRVLLALDPSNAQAFSMLGSARGGIHALLMTLQKIHKSVVDLDDYMIYEDRAAIQLWMLFNVPRIDHYLFDKIDVEREVADLHKEVSLDQAQKQKRETALRSQHAAVQRHRARARTEGGTPGNEAHAEVHAQPGHRSDDGGQAGVHPDEAAIPTCRHGSIGATEAIAALEEFTGGKGKFLHICPDQPCPVCLKEPGTIEHLRTHSREEVALLFGAVAH